MVRGRHAGARLTAGVTELRLAAMGSIDRVREPRPSRWRIHRRSAGRRRKLTACTCIPVALLLAGVEVIAAAKPASAAPAQAPAARCEDPALGHAGRGVPAPDLACVELLPTTSAPAARGALFLRPTRGPFTVSVDRDGVLRHQFVLEAEGLPAPGTLGPYTRYVVWITPPGLSPMIALGEARNGRVELEQGGLDTYLILVSAEGPDPVRERTGPLVLRGTSPAMVLRPHDLPWILAEMSGGAGASDSAHALHAVGGAAAPGAQAGPAPASPLHLHDAALPLDTVPWLPPAMHPLVQMPQQLMTLRPGVSAFFPFPGAADGGPLVAPDARPPERVSLADGDTLLLEAAPLYRRIGRLRVPGYGFNGQSPGPIIEAEQGATVHVRFRNRTPVPGAVHWHGIRLDGASDGVPGVTQAALAPGEEFLYELRLPDEGSFWYHPHVREDVMQDMGLAGGFRVHPAGERYAPVDHEEVLVLDDVLTGPEGPVPYGREAPTHALMGRFGDVLLVNGREDWSIDVRAGEVVRFHLTNAASTRTFNVSFGDLPIKLVASDGGKLPIETWVESVVLAPAERWVVEVRFPSAGMVAVENRVRTLDPVGARFLSEVRSLATVRVSSQAAPADRAEFSTLREVPSLRAEVEALLREYAARPPDRTLVLGLRTGALPFPLDPLLRWESVYRPPVEWAGTMPEMDWLATGLSVEWLLRDAATGAENMEIGWRFRVGDRVRLRIVNDRDVVHAMQHSIHLHGQRFLVLTVDGVPNAHPGWKDTVLVPTGSVVDVLVQLDNPGPWMLHCHIAEHLETGMMTVIRVEP